MMWLPTSMFLVVSMMSSRKRLELELVDRIGEDAQKGPSWAFLGKPHYSPFTIQGTPNLGTNQDKFGKIWEEEVKVGKFPFSASGKAKVIGDSSGFAENAVRSFGSEARAVALFGGPERAS